MYVMVPVPLPMGQQQAGYGWNGPSFPVNHPSYSGSDWDNGHASSSRAALMPQRSTNSYRSHHERRYRKNCCSCWRCAVRPTNKLTARPFAFSSPLICLSISGAFRAISYVFIVGGLCHYHGFHWSWNRSCWHCLSQK